MNPLFRRVRACHDRCGTAGRRLTIALLFLLPGGAGVATAQLNEPYIVRDTVTDCLNVRSDPSTAAEPITCLVPGTPVTVIGTAPYWREIEFEGGQTGWAAKKYLEPDPAAGPDDDPSPGPFPGPVPIPDEAVLAIHFVDVGQGDAIWIQTHDDGIDGNGIFDGLSIVIDGGPYSADESNPFLPYIEDIGHHGAEIEALIVTHPHTDHYRGAETISRHFEINHYYDPGYPSTRSGYNSFLNAMRGSAGQPARAEHVHLGLAEFGDLDWGGEIAVEVLHCWTGDATGLGSDSTLENNASIVLRIQYGEHVFLLMGDAEGKDRDDPADTPRYVEAALLQAVPDRLPATVLKIAHHGSETSSTVPFIQAVDPDILIVQSGRHSFNGTFLPDASTLQRYCDHDPTIRIFRTDQGDEAAGHDTRGAVDGDHIILRSNGSGDVQVEAFEDEQPFTVDDCTT